MSTARDRFLARQPILDKNQQVVAYALFFRREERAASADIGAPQSATASVIIDTFSSVGIDAVLGRGLGFIIIPRDLLQKDLNRPGFFGGSVS